MLLASGTRLGPYEIVAPLGSGGMGDVYRARDTRLGRVVAVKVLPADVARDPARLQRFEQEARAVAGLNHPNILALHDVGTERPAPAPDPAAEPVVFFVTELLEGRSLRQVLADERLTTSRAIDIATGMAEGLAAAHARGVIHRDIKPDNVFVTTDGHVKLLDFGLAKSAQSAVDQASAPTQVATETALVLGTPGYMSPEQARAEAADSRSDIFSFGAVLYEMLSGRRAFAGNSTIDLLSAIVRDAPAPIPATPDRPMPPALVGIVERCLEKTPAARFQSTTDLAFALKTLSRTDSIAMSAIAAPPAALPASARRPALTALVVGGVAVVAVGVLLAVWRPWTTRVTPAPAQPPAQTVTAPPPVTAPPVSAPPVNAPLATTAPGSAPPVAAPAASTPAPSAPAAAPATPPKSAGPALPVQRLAVSLADTPIAMQASWGAPPLALSADGARLAYVATERTPPGQPPSQPALYVRPVNEFKAARLAGTEGASGPFFSADGTWIGYLAGGKLMKVPATGGTPTVVATGGATIANGGGGSWGSDGRIVFDSPLFRIPSTGGVPEDLHQNGRSAQVLPGGAVLFTEILPAPDNSRHVAVLRADGSVKQLVRNAMNPRYVAPGYLVYADRSALMAAPFDAKRLEVTGSAVQVLDGVQGSPVGWSAFSVSANGSLAYLPGTFQPQAGRTLLWIDRDGHETPWPFPGKSYGPVFLSPDDSLFLTVMPAATMGQAPANTPANARVLFVGDFGRTTITPLTDSAPTGFAWLGGPGRVIYAKADGSLFWRRSDFTQPEVMIRPTGSIFVISLGPDNLAVAPGNRAVVWAGRDPATPSGPVGLYLLSGLDPAAPGGGTAMKIERIDLGRPESPAYPRVSGDGKWLAYILRRGPAGDLWIRPFAGSGPGVKIDSDVHIAAPEWRGRNLFWRKTTGATVQVVSATLDPTDEFHAGPSHVIYAYTADTADGTTVELLSGDARRFAASRSAGPPPPTQINLIINWVEELKQRLK